MVILIESLLFISYTYLINNFLLIDSKKVESNKFPFKYFNKQTELYVDKLLTDQKKSTERNLK
jgi:hypothetical protein